MFGCDEHGVKYRLSRNWYGAMGEAVHDVSACKVVEGRATAGAALVLDALCVRLRRARAGGAMLDRFVLTVLMCVMPT